MLKYCKKIIIVVIVFGLVCNFSVASVLATNEMIISYEYNS
ncbi:hypothetical protein [Helcococcus bovis]